MYTPPEIFLQTCTSPDLSHIFGHYPKQEKHFILQSSVDIQNKVSQNHLSLPHKRYTEVFHSSLFLFYFPLSNSQDPLS